MDLIYRNHQVKKILLLSLLGLVFSTNAIANSKFEPKCKTSGFDNSVGCSTPREYGVFVFDKPTVLSSVAIGGIWLKNEPRDIGLTISLGDISTIIKSISFNIDGNIQTFPAVINSSKSRHLGGRLWKSEGLVIIPMRYLETLLNNKDAKYRIVTTDGSREGSFYSVNNGNETEPVNTLKALLEKANELTK